MNITPLFPKAVADTTLDRELTQDEWNAVRYHENHVRKNAGNVTSIESQILDNDPRFSNIKEFILKNVKEYFDTVICPDDPIEPYITLSWLNYTYKGGTHHKHAHGNSILSGVFYISVASDDKIFFYNDKYSNVEIYPDPKKYNQYNSISWWLPAEKNMLRLFPSDIQHSVGEVEEDVTRISLAFNVFVRGEIGSKHDLKWIHLK